jgi:hypothetical protein
LTLRAARVLVVLPAIVGACTASDDGRQASVTDCRSDSAVVRLDHVPVAVADLEVAQSTYSDSLGFSLKPGYRHPSGIRNTHIKYVDGSQLELISVDGARGLKAAWVEVSDVD